jgi:hypothetical protein
VCDGATHECRPCVRDSECPSGACDLAIGGCVEERAIRYASPAGTTADACTRLSPCSLSHAASIIDTSHVYLVLLPGIHTSGATFAGKVAIVAGNSATIDVTSSGIEVTGGSSVKFRDFTLNTNQEIGIFGSRDAIRSEGGTDIAIDNLQATLTSFVNTIRSGGALTIRNSRISRGNVTTSGLLVIDRATVSDAQLALFSSGEALRVSNSLFIGEAGSGGIFVSQNGGSNDDGTLIINNTFVEVSISCQGATLKHIESNIFYDSTLIASSDCIYDYNLITPNMHVGGVGNKTGDPMFVDSSKNDFHLGTGSPAIDAANPNRPPPFAHDHDGVPRPQGVRADIGAFEHVPPAR